MSLCQDSEVKFLIIHQQEGEKTSVCVEIFTSSSVGCKTQHCVMEFGKNGTQRGWKLLQDGFRAKPGRQL